MCARVLPLCPALLDRPSEYLNAFNTVIKAQGTTVSDKHCVHVVAHDLSSCTCRIGWLGCSCASILCICLLPMHQQAMSNTICKTQAACRKRYQLPAWQGKQLYRWTVVVNITAYCQRLMLAALGACVCETNGLIEGTTPNPVGRTCSAALTAAYCGYVSCCR